MLKAPVVGLTAVVARARWELPTVPRIVTRVPLESAAVPDTVTREPVTTLSGLAPRVTMPGTLATTWPVSVQGRSSPTAGHAPGARTPLPLRSRVAVALTVPMRRRTGRPSWVAGTAAVPFEDTTFGADQERVNGGTPGCFRSWASAFAEADSKRRPTSEAIRVPSRPIPPEVPREPTRVGRVRPTVPVRLLATPTGSGARLTGGRQPSLRAGAVARYTSRTCRAYVAERTSSSVPDCRPGSTKWKVKVPGTSLVRCTARSCSRTGSSPGPSLVDGPEAVEVSVDRVRYFHRVACTVSLPARACR